MNQFDDARTWATGHLFIAAGIALLVGFCLGAFLF